MIEGAAKLARMPAPIWEMTRLLEWNHEHDTGNQMVDREHHELIELTNLLLVADENAYAGSIVEESLDALHRYVDQHFHNEETLLDAVGSPHLPCQRLQHKSLRNELDNLWRPGRVTPTPDTVHALALWVENRLVNHFMTHDFMAFHAFPFNDEQSPH